MDRHERPYVCNHPRCENIRGFTYSAGLHRHQKEVHGQHGGPRGSCYCPYKDCKRSTGVGFSRKENLAEHIRRVHRKDDSANLPHAQEEPSLGEDSQPLSGNLGARKRRRKADDTTSSAEAEDSQSSHSLRLEVKKLKKELAEKDERLLRLEEQMKELLAKSQ